MHTWYERRNKEPRVQESRHQGREVWTETHRLLKERVGIIYSGHMFSRYHSSAVECLDLQGVNAAELLKGLD